jgi:hypothetical protein
MADITLSSAVRNNLLSLQNTASLLSKTQERLATGLKVNSALDDPTAFFTASSLNSRAGDLNRLLDSVGNAVQTVKAADEGISALTKLVENAQATARQALQNPAATTTAAAAATVTGGVTFAADDTAAVLSGTGGLFIADTAATVTGAVSGGIVADVNPTGTGASLGGDPTLASLGFATGGTDTIVFNYDGGTFTVNLEAAGATNDAAGANNATTVSINIDDLNGSAGGTAQATVSDLATAINSGFGGEIDASFAANALTIAGDSGSNAVNLTIQVDDGAGGGGAADQALSDALGFTNAQSGSTNGLTTITAENALINTAVASNETLTFTINGSSDDIVFGNGGGSEVNSLASLSTRITALNGTSNTNAAFSLAGNQIVVTANAGTDGDLVITGGADALAAGGFSSGQLSEATNGNFTASFGQQLTFTVNGSSDVVSFGASDASNEVSNRAELVAALSAISGANGNTGATFALTGGNNITATASAVGDGDVSVAGGAAALTLAGLTGGQSASTTNAALTALVQNDFTVNFGGAGAETIDFSAIGSVSQLDTALGNLVNGTGARTGTGAISFTGANTTDNIVIAGTITGTGHTAATTTATAASTTNNAERAALETEFNNIRTQIDQLAGDASFNGNNLLNGDSLSVIFNAAGTSTLAVTGVTFDSTGLGVTAAATDSFQSNTSVNATLAELDTAIGSLRQQASTFGSNLSVVEIRQDFTKNLINTLETGAANLTLADSNEEGANTLALQTRQQLSGVALSLASQADQQVLRLF